MTIQERVTAVLQGRTPDRLPFIDRMEVWYKSKHHSGTLPHKFKGMSLNEVHRSVGMGRQKFSVPYALRLHGVEVIYTFDTEIIDREFEPVSEYFPAQWAPEQVPRDKGGATTIEYRTPVGKLTSEYTLTESLSALRGVEPYLTKHLIQEVEDYRTVEYIIERAEFIPKFDNVRRDELELGEGGFVVPCLHRIPFQQALLEYLGEIPLFSALFECPARLDRLVHLLDQQLTGILHQLSDLPSIYVEFGDNLDGVMTNPKLFKKFGLPYYQKYTEILHAQAKKVGSHADGNLKPLVHLLPESGLDVCESFSPSPLTDLTFEEAWASWEQGPLIWGGFPSPILEARTEEREFQDYVQAILERIRGRGIILGIGDMVLDNNLIERVEYIAQEVENHTLT